MGRFTGLLGLVAILALAWLLSTNRKAIRWRTAAWGLGLQWMFAVLVLRFDAGERALAAAGDAVNRMLAYAFVGSGFVFGELGKQHSSYGLIIAFQVLPTIIFISAFFAVLYHLGIMQIVIKGAARLMQLTMGISGAESLNVAASIFMGQTEAPLSIRPFLPGATRSELMTIMTSGMAHVSGGIMAAYILYGIEAKHSAGRGDHDRARYRAGGQNAGARDAHSRHPGPGYDAHQRRAPGGESAGRHCPRNH